MRKLFYAFLCCILCVSSHATEDSGMTPRLGIILPVKQEGKEVIITQSVLWNPLAIIPAGSHARMLLIPDDKDKGLYKNSKRAALKQSYMRKANEDQLESTKQNERQKLEERIAGNIWESEGHFRAVLERKERDNMYFVYLPPGAEEVEIELVDFPEGMFLGQKDDRIEVLSVVNGSDADRNEIKAGMTLKEIDNTPVGNDLKKFGVLYNEKKKAFGETKKPLSMIFETDAGVIKTIEFKPPVSLEGDFWSQFPDANKNSGGMKKLNNNGKTPTPEPAPAEDKPKDLIFNK